jgi:hypothetical protein
MEDYKINGKVVTLCGLYFFKNYDQGINPLYTGDEIRTIDFSCSSLLNSTMGVINNSLNNFIIRVLIQKFLSTYGWKTTFLPGTGKWEEPV